MSNLLTSHKISRRTLFKVGGGLAAAAVATRYNLIQPATSVRAAAATNTKKGRITPADRKAAAARMAKYKAQGLVPQAALAMNPGGVPDYFGTIPNWANSPLPAVDTLGNVTAGGIQKFVDALPVLGSGPTAVKNGLGQYLPVATPDTLTYPNSDYYEISLIEYTQQMHTNLMPTTLRGYVQTNLGTAAGANTVAPNPVQYMGPIIVVQRDRPVRVKFTNNLPIGDAGNLFIPCDTTAMGAGDGPQMYIDSVTLAGPNFGGAGYRSAPTVGFTDLGGGTGATATATISGGVVTAITVTNAGMNYTPSTKVTFSGGSPRTVAMATANVIAGGVYTQNRATLHLHGGDTVWISDGTPHQWTTPANDIVTKTGKPVSYPKGVSVVDVPDMPATGPGEMTFFYSNQQSARLMFYHDHAYGITRLNVYAGEAAGYVITDPIEQTLVNGGTIPVAGSATPLTVAAGTVPNSNIPLIIQDKTFINPDPLVMAAQDPTWMFPLDPTRSNLWFTHVYMPNQNPADLGGANACGRWDYGPWFWPPFTGLINGEIPNPLAGTSPVQGPTIPGIPNPSQTPESFMDTMLVNGTVYPYLEVAPQAYRFRILNANNDRALNLSLFQADPNLVNNPLVAISLITPGSGYVSTDNITVTIPAPTTGVQATANATFDPQTGTVSAVIFTNPGSGYTTAPLVSISAPLDPLGVAATAIAIPTGIGAGKEVHMVPAIPGAGLPPSWPTDGRDGGVPDPKLLGPNWIQIGTEGGLLPAVAVIPPMPIGYDYNRRSITVLNVLNKSLYLMPAERADVVVDFSAYPVGTNLILYNDSPAPVPAFDPRWDYYTGNPDLTSTGGTPTTMPGYGPNTRTVMQIRVVSTIPVTSGPVNLPALKAALPVAFAASQPAPIVPQLRHAVAYPAMPAATFPADAFVRIQDNYHTWTPAGPSGTPQTTMHMEPKAIQELFEVKYGRMNATMGMELPFTNMTTQTTIPYGYVDPVTEIFKPSDPATLVGSAGDGTQIWKITHNGVDTHGIHFHLFNVQVINRVGWDGAVKPPDDNEIGWKDTVRMNPLEDCIVAVRPVLPTNVPFMAKIPNSVRLIDPTMPLGATGTQFTNIDPNNNPITVVNEKINFGWEYVWHCHILGHEENDMMRAMMFVVPPASGPTALVATGASAQLRVNLKWTAPASVGAATSITIQRALDAAFATGLTTFSVPVTATTYTDQPIVANTTYYYRVMASNLVGGVAPGAPSMSADSLPSNTVQVGVPAAPSGLVNTPVQTARGQAIVLQWKDNAPSVPTPPNDVAERNFTVQRGTSANGPWTTLSTTVAPIAGTGGTGIYSDTKALPARDYWYRVIATNFFGSSAPAPVVHVRTL